MSDERGTQDKARDAPAGMRAREMFSARLAGVVMTVERGAAPAAKGAPVAVARPVAKASRPVGTAWPAGKDVFAQPAVAPSRTAGDTMVRRAPARAVSVVPARAPGAVAPARAVSVAKASTEPRVAAKAPTEPRVVAKAPTEPRVVAKAPTEPRVVARASTEPRVAAKAPTEPRVVAKASTEPRVAAKAPTQPRVATAAKASTEPRIAVAAPTSVSCTDDAPAPAPVRRRTPVHPGHVELIDGVTRKRISRDPVHKVPEAHRFAPTAAGHVPVVRIVITTKNGQRTLAEHGPDGRLLRTSSQPVS